MAYLDDPADLEGNYVARHWRGGLPLPLAYWVNGVVGGTIVSFAAPPMIEWAHEHMGSLRASAIMWFFFFFFFLAFWVWTQVGIWRSASHHEERGGHAAWAMIARIMVGLATLGLAVQLHNLVLQGIEFGSLAFGYDPIGNDARMELAEDGRTLAVTGNLTAGSADRFAARIGAAPRLAVVSLESNGGRIFEGQRMAELVQARGLDTIVEGHCASACTFVLIAGRHRIAGPRARIGFHQPSFPGMSEADSALMVAKMRELYQRGGVRRDFLDRVLEVPPHAMWYPPHDLLIEARVITALGAPGTVPD